MEVSVCVRDRSSGSQCLCGAGVVEVSVCVRAGVVEVPSVCVRAGVGKSVFV